MKYETMIKIMMLLLTKRKLTASQIADRYGISTRSVYRYVEELNVCGVPVDVTRGRYGGIYVADTFRLPTGYLTRGEKLKRQQKADRRELSVCGNIIVDGGTWGGGKKFSEKMRVCESAVNDKACLLIDYISRGGEHSKRVIDPHVLIFKQNVWYVYAFCHTKQTFRTFKIGRIKSASFTGEKFLRKEFTRDEIDLDFYYHSEKFTDVTLEINKSSLADVEEWLGIDNIEPRGNSFFARMALPDDGGLVNKILSFGGAVKVLEPAELKEKVAAAARKIAEEY